MIDINELRRKLGSDDLVDHVDIHANVKPILTELLDRIEVAEKERDALRAEITEMEQQEPVAWCATDETETVVEALGMNKSRRFDTALYLAPGAQPAPSVPVDLITDYLVSISAHVAHQDDPKAQAEIGELLRMLAAAPEDKP